MKTVYTQIPPELRELGIILLKEKKLNKKSLKSLFKVYTALLYKHNSFNKKDKEINGLFPIPSTYLKKFVSNYSRYTTLLIENKIIDYYTIELDYENVVEQIDLFEMNIVKVGRTPKKYYNKESNACIRYNFLINTTVGEFVPVELNEDVYIKEDWFDITKRSLEEIGMYPDITRCSYGRRLHTPITRKIDNDEITSYKSLFPAITASTDQKYSCIDVVACQPNILYQIMLDSGAPIDKLYKELIDNNTFYEFISDNFTNIVGDTKEERRNEAKVLFCKWVNGEWFSVEKDFITHFPKVSFYLSQYKKLNGYKGVGGLLQRKESSIIIDDILSNVENDLGISFILTVHDSFIVEKEDMDMLLEYCKDKYPQLKFKEDEL